MGMSASADLFYGYNLGLMVDDHYESTAPAWWQEAEDRDDTPDWEDELAKRLGWTPVPFPDDYPERDRSIYRLPRDQFRAAEEEQRRIEDEYRQTSPGYLAWSESRDAQHRFLASVPVALDTYGHEGGDTSWVMRVKKSAFTVYGCDCVELGALTVGAEWDEQLRRFAELLEFDVTGKPGWHVSVSYR